MSDQRPPHPDDTPAGPPSFASIPLLDAVSTAPSSVEAAPMPTKSAVKTVDFQSKNALRDGLIALFDPRHLWLSGLTVLALAILVVATLGPILPATRTGLATIGFEADQTWKLWAAAFIYDSAMVYGLYRLVVGLGLLGREKAALAEIESRCIDYSGRAADLTLAKLEEEGAFVAAGQRTSADRDGIRRTAAYKMSENIRLDATGHRFDPVNLIVERVLGSVTSSSSGLRDAQQFGVRLGILGTFVGIVFSLSHVGSIVNTGNLDNAVIQKSIHEIVRSLGIAFTTSIAGLTAAILLQLMSGSMRSRENDLVEVFERQAARVQAVCRRIMESVVLDEKIATLSRLLEDHSEKSAKIAGDVRAASTRFHDELARVENRQATSWQSLEQNGRRLAEVLDVQGRALASLERANGAIGEMERRVSTDFQAAFTLSAETQRSALADVTRTLQVTSTALVDEIRSGWGRDAREAFETLVDRRLGEAATRLDDVAERQQNTMLALARRLAAAMIFAAVALLLLAGQTSGVFAWIHTHLVGR